MASEIATGDPPRRIAVLISGSGTNLQALIDACNTPRLPHAHIVLVLSNRKAAYGLTRATSASPPIPTAYIGLQPFLRAHPGATRAGYDLAVARAVLEARPDVLVLAGWMHIVSEGFLEVMSGVRGVSPVSALISPRERADEGQAQAQTREQEQEQGPARARARDQAARTDGADTHPSARPHADADANEDEDEDGQVERRTERDIPVINVHPALPGQFDGANALERGFDAFQRGEVDKLGVMVHRVIAEVDRGAPVVVREVEVHRGEDLKSDYEPRVHRTEWEAIVEATRMVLDEVRPLSDRA